MVIPLYCNGPEPVSDVSRPKKEGKKKSEMGFKGVTNGEFPEVLLHRALMNNELDSGKGESTPSPTGIITIDILISGLHPNNSQ